MASALFFAFAAREGKEGTFARLEVWRVAPHMRDVDRVGACQRGSTALRRAPATGFRDDGRVVSRCCFPDCWRL